MKNNKIAYIVGFFGFHFFGAIGIHAIGMDSNLKLLLLQMMRSIPFIEAPLNSLIEVLGLHGFFGTYWIVVLFAGSSLGLGLFLYLITYLFARSIWYQVPKKYQVEDMTTGFNVGQTPGVNISFVSPKVAETKQTKLRTSVEFDWPIRRKYAHFQGQELIPADVKDPVDRLKLGALGILKAHSDVPAALTGHHAGESLLEHSKNVVRNIRTYSDDRLADLIALFHDIGKIQCYKKGKNGQWKRAFYNHSVLAFTIASKQPDYQNLTQNDRDTLRDVLTYYYQKRLPTYLDGNTRVLSLITAIKKADSLSTSQESSELEIPNEFGFSPSIIMSAIEEMNVNGNTEPSHPDGWCWRNSKHLLINPMGLFESLKDKVGPEEALRLQLDINIMNQSKHNGMIALTQTLNDMGMFIQDLNDQRSESGLFDVKLGRMTFRNIMAVEMDIIRERLDVATIESWGEFQHEWTNTKPAKQS